MEHQHTHETTSSRPANAPAANETHDFEQIASSVDDRERRLFESLDHDNDGYVLRSDFDAVMKEVGLDPSDPRLAESLIALDALGEPDETAQVRISRRDFVRAIRPNITIVERALQGRMVVPDFVGLRRSVTKMYRETWKNAAGKPADYIPQLDLSGAAADQFGVGLCTIDGQRFTQGDAGAYFTVQSTCKPFNYCLALEEHGEAGVHRYIGHEPSGVGFNELTLDKTNHPHNPMINAGAIMTSALIHLSKKGESTDKGGWAGRRFERVLDGWQAACGGARPHFNTSVFLSERETADRNYALAYFMREKKAFPEGVELEDALEFYFQCCSIEVTAETMAVFASTLANGGICPLTNERVFSTDSVRRCLSLMSSCGMYDFSGEFAFSIGLPAKSGVSGAVVIVIPNLMGLCVWSPRLDEIGNSVRGIEFCRRLVEEYSVHHYDSLNGRSVKADPRVDSFSAEIDRIDGLIWAASKGDLHAIREHLQRGAELTCADYDRRTPLHLAAAENQLGVVKFIVERDADPTAKVWLSPRDRWGGTPLDDAERHGHDAIVKVLEAAGARRGDGGAGPGQETAEAAPAESCGTAALIWAASTGDLRMIRRLIAQGARLDGADYDRRTAIHLAAAEGQTAVLGELIAHGVEINPADRWGRTPLDEARRHGHTEAADLLLTSGGTCGTDTQVLTVAA